MPDRRTFLRGLASLPLIGGGVTLIGNPTAAAVPVTSELMQTYRTWLHYEHRFTTWEVAKGDSRLFRELLNSHELDNPAGDYHDTSGPAASTRAAVVLSAVGCSLTEDRDVAEGRGAANVVELRRCRRRW